MTNSPKLAKFIDDTVVCEENIKDLFLKGFQKHDNVELIQHQMKIVKEKHTFMNRSKGILKLV